MIGLRKRKRRAAYDVHRRSSVSRRIKGIRPVLWSRLSRGFRNVSRSTHVQTVEPIAEHDTRTVADRTPDGIVRVDVILLQNARETVSEEPRRFIHNFDDVDLASRVVYQKLDAIYSLLDVTLV